MFWQFFCDPRWPSPKKDGWVGKFPRNFAELKSFAIRGIHIQSNPVPPCKATPISRYFKEQGHCPLRRPSWTLIPEGVLILFFPEWDSHQKMLSHHAGFPVCFSAFHFYAFVYVLLLQVFVALAEPDLARSKCCFCYLHGLWHGGSNLVSEPERQLRYAWIQVQGTNDIPHTFIYIYIINIYIYI